jgi:hypothetical protein
MFVNWYSRIYLMIHFSGESSTCPNKPDWFILKSRTVYEYEAKFEVDDNKKKKIKWGKK